MNKVELINKLNALEIRPSDYSLDGTLKPMRTILYFEYPNWLTFEYDERGHILDKKQFDTEDEACGDMLERLTYLRDWRIRTNTK
jgi:hypothetical protein